MIFSCGDRNCISGDCKNGQGTYTYIDLTLDRYVGEFKDEKRHSQGIMTYTNGDKYVGEWMDDKQNGKGTLTTANGSKYVGEFKDDKKNGQGAYTARNGDKYVGEFKDDKKNGQGTLTYRKGDKYVGEFKDGNMHGQGTWSAVRGCWSRNKYHEGAELGVWTIYVEEALEHLSGDKYVGEFKDNKRNGQGTYTCDDGTVYKGIWENDHFIGDEKYLGKEIDYDNLFGM